MRIGKAGRVLGLTGAGTLLGLGLGAAEAQADSTPLRLQSSEIQGSQMTRSYYRNQATGTRTDAPLHETAQNVRVLGRQQIDDLGALRLDQVLDQTSGVTRQHNFGGLWDNFAIRGFSGDENTGADILRNGFAANRGFNASRDMANVEHIEFLKGPASALYGRSDPGGTLNIVTKRPQWTPGGTARLRYGSFDRKRAELDVTGPVSDQLAYRLNLAAEDNDSFRDKVTSRREFVAPALTFRASDQTLFLYDGEYLRHRTPLDRGVVAVNGRLGAVPVSRFLGEPADGPIEIENHTHQLSMEHSFNPDWRSRVAMSYKEGTLEGFSTEPSRLIDGQTLRRQRRFRDNESTDYSFQAELYGRLITGGVVHNLVAGADTYRFEIEQRMLRINPTDRAPYQIDIFNPIYGQPQPQPGPNTHRFERQKAHAFFVQNQMELGDQWRLLGGVRFDNYRQSQLNLRNGAQTSQSATETSPRLGVVYLATDQISVYANASESFRPNTGADAGGRAFDPEQGRSYEVGAKYETLDGRWGATLALFNARKKNVVTADPDPQNAGFSIAAGEVQSEGIELDLSGQLTDGLRLSFAYAYIDAEVRRDNTLREGARLLNIPRHAASALAVQEIGSLGFGAGVNHVGRRSGDIPDSGFELPAYTVVKLLGYYQLTPAARLTVDVDNLFDRDHYVSSYSDLWVTPGTRRSITGSLAYTF
jgi:iron complex outermembrane recepter protein